MKRTGETITFAIFSAILFTLAVALIADQLNKRDSRFVLKTTDLSHARSIIRECTQTIGGTAAVDTLWKQGEEPVPESWVITCTWDRK